MNSAAKILDTLRTAGRPMSRAELRLASGLSKTATFTTTKALEAEGLIFGEAEGNAALAFGLTEAGSAAAHDGDNDPRNDAPAEVIESQERHAGAPESEEEAQPEIPMVRHSGFGVVLDALAELEVTGLEVPEAHAPKVRAPEAAPISKLFGRRFKRSRGEAGLFMDGAAEAEAFFGLTFPMRGSKLDREGTLSALLGIEGRATDEEVRATFESLFSAAPSKKAGRRRQIFTILDCALNPSAYEGSGRSKALRLSAAETEALADVAEANEIEGGARGLLRVALEGWMTGLGSTLA